MNARQTFVAILSLVATALTTASPALADPLPGRDMLKFSQQPMDQTAVVGQIYWGHDEPSTAYAPSASCRPLTAAGSRPTTSPTR